MRQWQRLWREAGAAHSAVGQAGESTSTGEQQEASQQTLDEGWPTEAEASSDQTAARGGLHQGETAAGQLAATGATAMARHRRVDKANHEETAA